MARWSCGRAACTAVLTPWRTLARAAPWPSALHGPCSSSAALRASPMPAPVYLPRGRLAVPDWNRTHQPWTPMRPSCSPALDPHATLVLTRPCALSTLVLTSPGPYVTIALQEPL